MNQQKKSLLTVHVAILLFGMSGLFAKMVDLSGSAITFGRVLFSSIFLWIILRWKKVPIRLHRKKDYVALFALGVVLAIHWTTFMLSIQLSTVAIGTITVCAFPLFVTFMEPYMFHEKLKLSSVLSAIVMLIGVIVMMPELELSNQMTQGILWGMVCSFFYALLSLGNRKFVSEYPGMVISLYEQGTSVLVLLPVMLIVRPTFTMSDVGGLILYGVVCTAIAHSLFIEGLKHIRVQTAGILSGLESVYGIVLAAILLHEIPSVRELIGGAIIFGVAFYTTLKEK